MTVSYYLGGSDLGIDGTQTGVFVSLFSTSISTGKTTTTIRRITMAENALPPSIRTSPLPSMMGTIALQQPDYKAV
jgi:hypothetical protein